MPGVDYNKLRSEIAIADVLTLLGFVATDRRDDQLHGPCPTLKHVWYLSVSAEWVQLTPIAIFTAACDEPCEPTVEFLDPLMTRCYRQPWPL
jgi:hypothetical protein